MNVVSREVTRKEDQRGRLLFQKERVRVTAGGEHRGAARREYTDQFLDSRVERIIDARRNPHGDAL